MPGPTFAYFLWQRSDTTALPLPVLPTDRIAVARGPSGSETTYYLELPLTQLPYSYIIPADGSTQTATEGLGAFVFNPAGALATLAVVLPVSPIDGQVFEISTSQDIGALTVSAPAGATVSGGTVGVLSGNGGCSWRYVESETTWFRRF